MFLARLEGVPLSKAYKSYVVEGGATDNAAQKFYLEDYKIITNKIGGNHVSKTFRINLNYGDIGLDDII